MKPIEFEEKYKCYIYGDHPLYKGKEIKQDAKKLLLQNNGFAYRNKNGLLVTEKGEAHFTKNSIEDFERKFIRGQYPLSDNQEYYLEFVGMHEDILIAKKRTL
jgi:hypothetical protein